MPTPTLEQLLNDDTLQVIILVDMSLYDLSGAATETLRFSNLPHITKSGDSPANTLYEPRVVDGFKFKRSLYRQGPYISGRSQWHSGSLKIDNTNGDYDSYLDLSSYDWKGRPVTIKIGHKDWDLTDFSTVLTGVLTNPKNAEIGYFSVGLAEKTYEIDQPVQVNDSGYYKGDTGHASADNTSIEGSEDVEGEPKPLAFGEVYNVPMFWINENQLIGVWHDGDINNVTAVYDSGVSLTEDTGTSYPNSPNFGEWNHNTSGLIRLGTLPVGKVTIDGEGFKTSGGTYITKTADIIQYLLDEIGPYSTSDLDTTSFSTLNTDQAATIGYFLEDRKNWNTAIDEILAGINGFMYTNRAGKIVVGRMTEPATSGNEDHEILEDEIVSIQLVECVNPAWRFRVGWRPNWSVMSENELAGSVTAPNRTFFLNERRIYYPQKTGAFGSVTNNTAARFNDIDHGLSVGDQIVIYDSTSYDGGPYTVATVPTSSTFECTGLNYVASETGNWEEYNHQTNLRDTRKMSVDPPEVPGLFADESDAQAESYRLMDLYGVPRYFYLIEAYGKAFQYELNETLKVTHSRFGLSGGKNFKIIGIDENGSNFINKVLLWG